MTSKRVYILALLALFTMGLLLASQLHEQYLALEEDNDFDSERGSMDAQWNLEELRHRLVATQRKLTTKDKDYQSKIAGLDADVDDLMDLFSKRPPGTKHAQFLTSTRQLSILHYHFTFLCFRTQDLRVQEAR